MAAVCVQHSAMCADIMVGWQDGRQIAEQVRRKGSLEESLEGLGKSSAPEGSGHGTGCIGQWAQPRVPEFKEHLDNALRHRVSVLSDSMCSQELGLLVLVGPNIPNWDIL